MAESGAKEGLCPVNVMHITASVFINDDESGLHGDRRWLESLAPFATLIPSDTITIATVKTTKMPITSVRSCRGNSGKKR